MAFKFTKPEDRKDYLYRCETCGEEEWYSIELPKHMLRHTFCRNILRKCGGTLSLIATRPAHTANDKHEGQA